MDDIICTSSNSLLISEFKKRMMSTFEMTDLGLLSYFLGLEIHQSKSGIFMSQEKYAKELSDEEIYRSLVGSLIYLTHTRPDLAYSVSQVSRYMQHPSKLHFGAVKRIMRYVAGTLNFGLWFEIVNNDQEVVLTGYSDWAGCFDDRKSISANVFTLGSVVITNKQNTAALSSTEAKYIASIAATCQAIWLRRILDDLKFIQKNATIIYYDNKSTICLSKNLIMHSRSKHIELKHHFVCE
ncbi:secreted RxLR effector protein 161-like [Bidens hawaiensis]|uniref:secreted RxLR effector protein 161-like n=1 Tax=Bidens hawaiensis TaxID=980011 RepID=UPI00404A5930